jgi:two-component system chemotaxis response regulator CheY
MSKKVVLVGHCGPDSSYLRLAVSRAQRDARVAIVEDEQEMEQAIAEGVDLLMLNRILDYGFEESDGAAVISKIRARHPEMKMMLVSNYAEAQAAAVAAGALPGFGKRDIGTDRVTNLIRDALAEAPVPKAE